MKYGDEFVKKNVINVDENKRRSSTFTQNILKNYNLHKNLSTSNETQKNPDFKLFSVSSKIKSVIINISIDSNPNGELLIMCVALIKRAKQDA